MAAAEPSLDAQPGANGQAFDALRATPLPEPLDGSARSLVFFHLDAANCFPGGKSVGLARYRLGAVLRRWALRYSRSVADIEKFKEIVTRR